MDARITASPLLGPLASSQFQLPERNYAISITLKTRRHGGEAGQVFHFEIPAASTEMATRAVFPLADAIRYAAGSRELAQPLEMFSVREMLAPREALSRIRTVIARSDEPYLYDERGSTYSMLEMVDFMLRARSASWADETQTHLVLVLANGQVKTFSMTPTRRLPKAKQQEMLAVMDETAAA